MIPISEIYGPVIQGEGQVAGVPTVFVRVGGCDYRCDWCDSLYAVLPKYKSEWTKMTSEQMMEKVRELADPPCLITLSGGNPALYPLAEFIATGKREGYRFGIETQGTKRPEWIYHLHSVTISPKPPSSKMKTNWAELTPWFQVSHYVPDTALKLVVFDDDDYLFAQEVYERSQGLHKGSFYLQGGTTSPYRTTDTFETMALFRQDILTKLEWLQNKVIADRWYDVRVLPQIHALVSGAKRGV